MLGSHPMWMAGGGSSEPPPPIPSSWQQATISPGGTQPRVVKYRDGRFVISNAWSGTVYTSLDGETWTAVSTSGTGSQNYRYEYNGTIHVFMSANTGCYTSTDFTTWTLRTIPDFVKRYLHWFDEGGVFIATGDNGAMATSFNGTEWTSRTSSFGTSRIEKVASGNGVCVAAGRDGKLAYSSNGINWTQVSLSFSNATNNYVTFGNGVFVLASANGEIYTSPDGISWTPRTKLGDETLNLGTFSGVLDLHSDETGAVVFVGTKNASSRGIYTTTNFTSYQAHESDMNDQPINSVYKSDSTWVCCGSSSGSNQVSFCVME